MHQEDVAYTFSPADLLAGVTDPDVVYDADGNITSRDVDQLKVVNLSVTNGDLTYDAEGDQYTFTPDANFNGIARFNYLITDGNGGSIPPTPSPSMSLRSTTLPRRRSRRISSPPRAIARSAVS